ncbi:unnamed protein product [Alternaria alternata]
MWTSNDRKSLLFTILGLLTTTFVNAQNYSCPGNFRDYRSVNSTGQHEFTWNSSYAGEDSWYVSVLIGSRETEWNDGSDVDATAYISAPGNVRNGTGYCSYQYNNINATLESGGENSCSGVISSVCIEHLTNALSEVATYCPSPDTGSTSEAFKKACPMLRGGSHNTKFIDVANNTCNYTDMPEVNIPDNYSTFGTVIGLQASDTIAKVGANETYDLLTRQTIPLVLLGRFIDPESNRVQRSVEFVCMTANNTVDGSRIPDQETPWESVGAHLSARTVGWVVSVVTAVMFVL